MNQMLPAAFRAVGSFPYKLYPEKKDNGRIISTIELRFPVYYNGQEGNEIRMPE